MTKVWVARPLPERVLATLRAAAEVVLGGAPDPQAVAWLTQVVDRVDARGLDAHPACKHVANVAVGLDNIDLAAARARGVLVTHTPGVLTEATADFTWALLLALARRVPEADRYVREGRFRGWAWDLMLGRELSAKTLGIVGHGRIGQAVARRAHGFGMTVLWCTRDAGTPLGELLARSDVVTLHAPYSQATHHLIGAPELARMKCDAVLVNTARGPLVDEDALVRALEAGALGGAALDVFEREPEVHPGLLELSNVVLAPHLGSATVETREAMAACAVDDVVRVLEGRAPKHPVR